jgi:hypothetical protein
MKELLTAWKDAAPATGAITAIVSVIVAFVVFHYTRSANRRRATLDMVMKTLLDEGARKAYADFKELLRKDKDEADCFKIESLVDPKTLEIEDRRKILHQLNIYELMSLGIRRGLFDESFYKRWYHNQFMTDYEGASAFIRGAQERKNSIYCEYTALYQKWSQDGHPSLSPGRLKMAYWAIMRKNEKIDRARQQAKAR